jgi:putative transposase
VELSTAASAATPGGLHDHHKRTQRLYRQFGFGFEASATQASPDRYGQVLLESIRSCQCWSLDFMSDMLRWGKPVRLLNAIDDYAREALTMEIEALTHGLPA